MVRAARDGPRAAQPVSPPAAFAAAVSEIGCSLSPSYHHIERAGQHVERFCFNCEDFAIDNYVDGVLQIKLDPRRGAPRSHRMANVRAVKRVGKFRNQSQAANRPPVNVFDLPLSIAACGAIIILPPVNLLLLKATKQTAAVVTLPIGVQRKRAAAQSSERNEHAHEIARLAQEF